MRIGYPCINRSIGCSAGRTFRLASYSRERLYATVAANLACLERILAFNREAGLFFFRIGSGLVPFASHPVCTDTWQEACGPALARVGRRVREEGHRISMHPDQFVVINGPDRGVLDRSVAELEYHAEVLDLMGLDRTARVQVHVGGVYGDRTASLHRFIDRAGRLPEAVRRRLVIENDDGRYSVEDCLAISAETGIPVLFDRFHHEVFGTGGPVEGVLVRVAATWEPGDGNMMVDFSTQAEGRRAGAHAPTLDPAAFARFLDESRACDPDIMLEVKDKERSALLALEVARDDPRLQAGPVR
ncbi:MAG TPA: UV DNA damage repair endonuclease UvsE [Methanoregulaceae archaeon]|mgnify:CR=1 FL=1|nr:UV DNA damage repair endonuclease UvsE [Methanoregulaceae archaeon]HQJ88745.1 UV DNA damage repair endonuclease UvsE [Methanoregulaceae archaeon]